MSAATAAPVSCSLGMRLSSNVGGFVALIALALPATSAAHNIYWSDSGSGQLRLGNLSGGAATTLLEGEQGPGSIALNPAAGRIYWADATTGQIRVGNLVGGGAAQTLYTEPEGAKPVGIAINAAAGKLYWTDEANGEIRSGSITGEGAAQTLFTEPEGAKPVGIAINAAAGKLYWTDEGNGEIRAGGLAGAGTPETLRTEPSGAKPSGIAIVASKSELYWTDSGSDEIRAGGLGHGAAKTVYKEPEGSAPRGIAVNTATGQLYWADSGSGTSGSGTSGPGTIRIGYLAGSGAPGTLFEGESGPGFPVLLLSPSGNGIPSISGQRRVGQTLTCGNGKWAANLPGSGFYEAPQSFAYQWLLNGSPISGATAATLATASAGSYVCEVTATNAAGSATQTSLRASVSASPPTVTISSPASGGTYTKGAFVSTAFSCAEGAGGPGLASCIDSNRSPAPAGHLNTAKPGKHTYTVTAVSKDGARARASITYTVSAPIVHPHPRPHPRPRPRVSIETGLASVTGRRTHLTLACSGRGVCHGRLSLTIAARQPGHRGRRGHVVRLTLAHSSYTLAPGSHRRIALRLSTEGGRLLARARGRRLFVRAFASVSGGRAASRIVRLQLRRRHRR